MEYIYGRNVIDSYLDSDLLLEIFICKEIKGLPLYSKIQQSKIKITETSKDYLDRLVQSNKHQGIVARVKEFNYTNYETMVLKANRKTKPVLLMLDGIEDPHNLGAIIRTVEAFQVDGIIIGKYHSAPINATVAKVSTGALAKVAIAQVTNLTQTLQDLKQKGYWIVAAEAYQGVDYTSIQYDMPTVLVMGSEGKGISRLVAKQADYRVFIPMYGEVNSLNVSVATAILLAHITRK